MTEPRRSPWHVVDDMWDPDKDPAQIRMREALKLGAAPPPPDPPKPSPSIAARPDPAIAERRGRIASLVARLKAGDLSAVEALKELLP